MKNWYDNAIIYELYIRAFADGNGDGHGDFQGLRQKLDYLQWLGVDCIWLLPMYPSPLKDDGYDVASYGGIHPQYGLMEDFQMAIEEIHQRGMRVLADLVVNHTSDQHPWFIDSRQSKNSSKRDFYVWSSTADKYQEAPIIFSDVETSNWSYDEKTNEYYWHRFYSSQPDLNYDNPQVQEAILNVMRFWLKLGIDGFRVDAVPFLFEQEGVYENLPQTHEFLQKMRAVIDNEFPDALLLAEACMSPDLLINYFGQSDEFHAAFHFPLMATLYQALAAADSTSVRQVLETTPPLPKDCQWAIFLRNHDELNLETLADKTLEVMNAYQPDSRYHFAGRGLVNRLAPLMNNDRRKIELMHSLLLTLPGMPVLYYGDEIGMGDDISLPDRNSLRTPMQWNDQEHGGFSSAPQTYLPSIHNPVYGYKHLNVESQINTPDSLLKCIRHLIHARKRLPVLGVGELKCLDNFPKQALCFWRNDSQTKLLILHNLSEEPLKLSLASGLELQNALNPECQEIVKDELILPAYGYRWYQVVNQQLG